MTGGEQENLPCGWRDLPSKGQVTEAASVGTCKSLWQHADSLLYCLLRRRCLVSAFCMSPLAPRRPPLLSPPLPVSPLPPQKPLGRRSYKEAVLTAGEGGGGAGAGADTTPTATTPTGREGASRLEPSEVQPLADQQAEAPAGPAAAPTTTAAAATESPRKRGFFGTLKKALGTSSSRSQADA